MQTMSIQSLLEKTTCVLLDSTTTDSAITHSIGLAIEMKVKGFHPIENQFHVHMDLTKTKDNQIIIENHTPPQMFGYRFWVWLEKTAPEGFLEVYVSKLFDRAQAMSVKTKLN